MTKTDLQSRPLVILGAGYTGAFLYPLAKAQGWQTYATSRNPASHLPYVAEADRLTFDLQDSETWAQIPQQAHLLWCFPAIPQDTVRRFIHQRSSNQGRLIILGSTSAYGREQTLPVDEQTSLDLALPRVQSEEYFREMHGAIILRLAGLYGPGRHVLDWMRKGKIKNTDKFVNLIHIDDVAAICLAALETSDVGEDYVVSDGIPRQWSEIFSIASQRWQMDYPTQPPTTQIGKRLNINKIKTTFNYTFRHPNLYQALDDIELHRQHSS